MNYLRKKSLYFFLATAFVFASSNTLAQLDDGTPELLQEFFVSETVFAQEKNEIQITVRPSYWKNTEGFKTLQFPLLLEYGITDRLQVELTLPYQGRSLKGEQFIYGKGNVEAGFLYNILKGNKPFALSVGLEVEFPTAYKSKELDDDEDDGGLTWEPSLVIARQFSRFQVHANLGAEITGRGSEFSFNIATAVPFGQWLATMEFSKEIEDNKAAYLTPGLIWKGIDDFEFGLGFSKSRKDWGVMLMATYEFSFNKN